MSASESTCWTVIRAAAAGSPADRDELARRYLSVVRAYLAARWRGSGLRPDVDDAVQEVFVECFRQGGALEAAWAGRVPSFRAFLNGVVRNVARRFESRPVRAATPLPENQADEESLSRLFERTWAQAIMSEAAQLPAATAAALWLLAIGKGAALRQLSVCGLYTSTVVVELPAGSYPAITKISPLRTAVEISCRRDGIGVKVYQVPSGHGQSAASTPTAASNPIPD